LFLAFFLIEVKLFTDNLYLLLDFLVNVNKVAFRLTSERFCPSVPNIFFLNAGRVILNVFDSAQTWDFFSNQKLLLFWESFIELLFVG